MREPPGVGAVWTSELVSLSFKFISQSFIGDYCTINGILCSLDEKECVGYPTLGTELSKYYLIGQAVFLLVLTFLPVASALWIIIVEWLI